MVTEEFGENQNLLILLKSKFFLFVKNKNTIFCRFSHEIAMAMHNEEERLYQEAQQQEQKRTRDEASPSESKKNKNKGKKPSSEQEPKDSCIIS